MNTLRIYNTLTKKEEDFLPRDGKKVHMFVCGPTVYDYAHIGNARAFVFFDVVAKYLRHKGYDLKYIQNITDIDDKIIERAAQEKQEVLNFAQHFEKIFKEDMSAIGVTSVNDYPRASDHIKEIVDQVERLIKNGNAYLIENEGYYFDLKSFPNYGKLSGRTIEKQGDSVSRIDENPNKRNLGDFALWKFSKPNEPAWDSPIGKGRPGWHIEDTTITEKYFGSQYDIHGGGQDLIFPHHEAEIAQQESVSKRVPFVKYWMHSGFLINKERKMSKSMGNFLTLHEALKKYSPEALRFYFLSAHYRSPLDLNETILNSAEAGIQRLAEFKQKLDILKKTERDGINSSEHSSEKLLNNFESAMDEDFNTPKAIAAIFDYVREINILIQHNRTFSESIVNEIKTSLQTIDNIFGIIPDKVIVPESIQELISQREQLRKKKIFDKADIIRQQIEKSGYSIEDTIYGPLIKKSA